MTTAKYLSNKLKHPEEPEMLHFFCDEKNFAQFQKVDHRNLR